MSQKEVYEFNVPTFGPGVVFDVDHKTRAEQFRFFGDALKSSRLTAYVPQFVAEARSYFAGWGDEGVVDLKDALADLIILTASRTLMGACVHFLHFFCAAGWDGRSLGPLPLRGGRGREGERRHCPRVNPAPAPTPVAGFVSEGAPHRQRGARGPWRDTAVGDRGWVVAKGFSLPPACAPRSPPPPPATPRHPRRGGFADRPRPHSFILI
jgi:hypothetical protein